MPPRRLLLPALAASALLLVPATSIGESVLVPQGQAGASLDFRIIIPPIMRVIENSHPLQLDTSVAGEASAQQRLIGYADGDARRLLNTIDSLVKLNAGLAEIDEAAMERSLGEQLRRYDKGGDQFYDTISALHKSVRGSDPDAALYWLVRMLDGGVDPRYVSRRLLRMASEDIGLADPRALQLAVSAAEVYERLGTPEGELALAQATVYLAMAPKSNAVYSAWNAVRELVRTDGTRPVPEHLRNAPTRLMKQLGHGQGYRYAHDEPDGFAAGERYLPEGLSRTRFYEPVPRGLELRIGERLAELRAANERARKP